MGRRKKYNRAELLDEAMKIFRIHGYAGTSTQMLVEKLGVNKFSIYSEFANKQKLFEAALELYFEKIIDIRFSPLESDDAGVEEIQTLLQFYSAALSGPVAGIGCLLCNTAIEFGPEDPGDAGYIEKYFKRISNAFRSALQNASRQGDIPESVSIEQEADFFTSVVLGFFVMIRANASQEMLQRAAAAAVQHLENLRN
ncbi:MAG: TetR/AcrR family transcriptional regulator [Leptospiraceae bacterium]|nr:TetR/AcrR family transcriptional regulator [Myxococcales bacterium]MCP5501314.1 TetR/AcrR family transcriptional regulator [Leptospiraceae bacterium]